MNTRVIQKAAESTFVYKQAKINLSLLVLIYEVKKHSRSLGGSGGQTTYLEVEYIS